MQLLFQGDLMSDERPEYKKPPKQQVGDICAGCEDFMKKNKMEPRALRALPGTTEKYGDVVAACDHCDGNVFKMRPLEAA